jgi:transposase-like protein
VHLGWRFSWNPCCRISVSATASNLEVPQQHIIEADHGALKQVIRPARGFQTTQTADATIKGFEIMRMIRRGHCVLREPDAAGEVRFINKLFGLPG